MSQRNSLQPGLRRGVVAGVLAALSSLRFRGAPVIPGVQAIGHGPGFVPQPNWLKGSLISQKFAPGSRGG